MTRTPTRPVLRYHGGKWRLAPWIIAHFPPHRVYVEPFGGAASVLLRKPRSYAEVYNEVDGEIVDFFRILRHPEHAVRLADLLKLTPFARAEFEEAYEPAKDRFERARRLVIRSFMGFGSDGIRTELTTGFRANSNRSGTSPSHDWVNYAGAVAAMTERLAGVVIEQRDALACMAQHDGPATLHYVDPPYMWETRKINHRGHGYRHELDNADHDRVLGELRKLQGMVVLSGYPSETYDVALKGWMRKERAAHADGAQPRTEVLWLNPACVAALGHGPLFANMETAA